MNRRDWFFKQKVTEAEMDDAFVQVEEAEKAIKSDAFTGPGPFLMAAVSVQEDSPQSTSVDVGPGTGWAKGGLRVVQPNASELFSFAGDDDPLMTDPRIASLYLVFDRALSDPRIDGLGATVQFKVDESFKLERDLGTPAPSPTPPAPRADDTSILIANVTIPPSAGVIQNSDIDTTVQNLQSDFPVERLRNMSKAMDDAMVAAVAASPSTLNRVALLNDLGVLPQGYFGEIKLVRSTTPTDFEVEFCIVTDRTETAVIVLQNESIPGTAAAAANSSGVLPGDTLVNAAGSNVWYYVYAVADSGNVQTPIAVLSTNPGIGFPGGSDITPTLNGIGYDIYRRIGAVPTTNAGAVLASLRKINGVSIYEDFTPNRILFGVPGGTPIPLSTAPYVPVTAEKVIMRGEITSTVPGQGFLNFRSGAAAPAGGQSASIGIWGIFGFLSAQDNDMELFVGPGPTFDIFVFRSGAAVIAGASAHVRGFVDDMKHL